ncbi:cupin domain [Tumebacillus sp. BK434]|uniref:cupin domain-containing protein n=1 Tax=Tumebacillus sp. BK434 TaxID=2512169 RepID=UPI001049B7E1|nr:cupin domain-containing protein [Tumebacillus sp. BK434]TCP53821.1 cupin domain [Tumebacillus sp. BK434]
MNRAETVFQNPAFGDESVGKVNNFTGTALTTNTYYFKPGQILDYQNRFVSDQVYVVLSGEGQCTLDNGQQETINIATGSVVFVPTGVQFKMTNSGSEQLICTEVCHPNHQR